MTFQGKLQDIPIIPLLQVISLSHESGTLTIYNPGCDEPTASDAGATFTFHNGKIVSASLADMDNSLLAILMRTGKLTDEQAQRIQKRTPSVDDRRLAMRLISTQQMTLQDIVTCVRGHVEAVIDHLSSCREGTYNFDPHALMTTDQIFVSVAINRAVA